MLIREISEDPVIYVTAGSDATRIHQTEKVAPRRGFALADAIRQDIQRLGGGGIFLTQCMNYVFTHEQAAERVIVLTNEQNCDTKLRPDQAKAFGAQLSGQHRFREKRNRLRQVDSHCRLVGGDWRLHRRQQTGGKRF